MRYSCQKDICIRSQKSIRTKKSKWPVLPSACLFAMCRPEQIWGADKPGPTLADYIELY